MSIFELWLLTTVIPNLNIITGITLTAGFIVLGCLLVNALINIEVYEDSLYEGGKKKYESAKALIRNSKKFIVALFILATFNAIIPSERQMLIIAGGYAVTNNAEIKKLPTNAAKAVNAWLDVVEEAADDKKK